MAQIEEME